MVLRQLGRRLFKGASTCFRKWSAFSRRRWKFYVALGFANLHCSFYQRQYAVWRADPAWPCASTYQSFLKFPLVINVIHLVGPREAQVIIIVHAGDAEAVLLLCRGALDELEQEKAGFVWRDPQTTQRTSETLLPPPPSTGNVTFCPCILCSVVLMPKIWRGFRSSALIIVAPSHLCKFRFLTLIRPARAEQFPLSSKGKGVLQWWNPPGGWKASQIIITSFLLTCLRPFRPFKVQLAPWSISLQGAYKNRLRSHTLAFWNRLILITTDCPWLFVPSLIFA